MDTSRQDIRAEIEETLMRELNITHLAPDDQKEIVSEFGLVVMESAMIAILKVLPEGKRGELAALMEKQDSAGMRTFLAREVPDYEQRMSEAIQEEVRRFKEFQRGGA